MPLRIDHLVHLVSSTLLSPLLTPLLFAALHFLPPSPLLSSSALLTTHRFLALFWVLSWLLSINRFASRWALNNGCLGPWAPKWDWGKEVVLLTGGAGGIGGEAVRELARRGVRVVVLDVLPLRYEMPEGVSYYRCDLSKPTEVEEVARRVQAEVGHPTVLVNNAGVMRNVSILDSTQRDVDLTYDINVKAHYYTIKAFLPEMLQQKHGHIITVASMVSYVQSVSTVAYCSSKAAALSFHEGLSQELLHLHHAPTIRTSVVCPGHVKTTLFEGFSQVLPPFLLPSLETNEVAMLLVECVLGGESKHVLAPWGANLAPAMRLLPAWVYVLSMGMGKHAMNKVRKEEYSHIRGKAD